MQTVKKNFRRSFEQIMINLGTIVANYSENFKRESERTERVTCKIHATHSEEIEQEPATWKESWVGGVC